MIYMGDEYGHTKGGNNNTYCHDNYVILCLLENCKFGYILFLWVHFLLFCSLITSDGIKRKNLHQTFSDFANL